MSEIKRHVEKGADGFYLFLCDDEKILHVVCPYKSMCTSHCAFYHEFINGDNETMCYCGGKLIGYLEKRNRKGSK